MGERVGNHLKRKCVREILVHFKGQLALSRCTQSRSPVSLLPQESLACETNLTCKREDWPAHRVAEVSRLPAATGAGSPVIQRPAAGEGGGTRRAAPPHKRGDLAMKSAAKNGGQSAPRATG